MSFRLPAPFVPAVLLILGTSLCCSTACIGYGAAVAITAATTAATLGGSAAVAQLEKNRVARVGSIELPTITADPASIERALRPALPSVVNDNRPEDASVHVKRMPDAGTEAVYEITATDDFTLDYAQAFAGFANRLRPQLPDRTKFVIYAYKWGYGHKLVARIEVN